jgi:hypothetical protein
MRRVWYNEHAANLRPEMEGGESIGAHYVFSRVGRSRSGYILHLQMAGQAWEVKSKAATA